LAIQSNVYQIRLEIDRDLQLILYIEQVHTIFAFTYVKYKRNKSFSDTKTKNVKRSR
jgi:hypothetical protein